MENKGTQQECKLWLGDLVSNVQKKDSEQSYMAGSLNVWKSKQY